MYNSTYLAVQYSIWITIFNLDYRMPEPKAKISFLEKVSLTCRRQKIHLCQMQSSILHPNLQECVDPHSIGGYKPFPHLSHSYSINIRGVVDLQTNEVQTKSMQDIESFLSWGHHTKKQTTNSKTNSHKICHQMALVSLHIPILLP